MEALKVRIRGTFSGNDATRSNRKISSTTTPLSTTDGAQIVSTTTTNAASPVYSKSPASGSEIAGIVVGIVGGLLIIIAIVILVLWLMRRKRHQQSKSAAAAVANGYQYQEFPPVQRLPSEHPYAVIDETDNGSTSGGFKTSQNDNVTPTSQTDCHVNDFSSDAMTSASDAPIKSNSGELISDVTLVENTMYG